MPDLMAGLIAGDIPEQPRRRLDPFWSRGPVAMGQFVRSDHRRRAGAVSLAAGFCERVWNLTDPMFTALRQSSSSVPLRDPAQSGHQASLLPQDQQVPGSKA